MTLETQTQEDEPTDIRPLVAQDQGNRPLWIGLGAILILGLLLLSVLETRRQSLTVPAVKPRVDDLAMASSVQPPPLYIPPEPVFAPSAPDAPTIRERGLDGQNGSQSATAFVPESLPASVAIRQPDSSSLSSPAPPSAPSANSSAILVVDVSAADQETNSPSKVDGPAVASRARASRLRNRATVVPQGTLIAAVLETALDSTQPGQVRALVSSDVVNLRGDRILIPRGSRLYGEYKGEIAAGQKRAFVQWTRLVRPDGVTIAIDSPAADQLGRAGIKGRVNSHFIERLGGALLQSTIDVGTIIASRSIYDGGSSVFVAVPGSVQGATSQLMGPAPKPTLKVRQGTRISVFVMRDLDFTAVESGR